MTRHIIYPILDFTFKALARLPLKILYLFSDFIFLIIYHVIRYRRKIAYENIRNSFPEKSETECKSICRKFFRNFADYIVETIKLGHISDEEIRRHVEIRGYELIDQAFDNGRNIILYFSHCGNWEWATSVTLWTRHAPSPHIQFNQIYRPLKNQWFDKYFLRLRSRFHSVSLDKRTAFRELIRLKNQGILSITGFMSDQKPSHGDHGHIVKFLNQPTEVITGTETVARKLNDVVMYWDVEKPSRGHYILTVVPISDTPKSEPEFSLTDTYIRMLQNTIRRNPSIWLWTHKRWNHKIHFPDNFIDNVNTDAPIYPTEQC